MRRTFQAVAIAVGVLFSFNAQAACKADKAGEDLTGAEAQAVYDCLSEKMNTGYRKGDKRWIPSA